MYGCLTLPYADSLDKDVVVAGGLTQHYCLAGLAGDTAEGSGRRTRADEGRGMDSKLLHACLVAEN